MRKNNTGIFLVNALLLLFPLIYISGFGSYNAPHYFFFASLSLIIFIPTTYYFFKNKVLFTALFKNWYFYGLIIYVLSFLITSLFGVDISNSLFSSFERTDGFFAILFLSLFTLSIYSIVSTDDGQKYQNRFLSFSVLGSTILSIFILLSPDGFSFLDMKWLLDSRGGAMLGNSSVSASYILWNIFFAIILFFRSDSIKKKILWIIPILILISSPLFLNWSVITGGTLYEGITSFIGSARGATLGVIFGLIISLSVYLLLQKNNFKKYIGLGVLIITLGSTIWGGVSLLDKSSLLHNNFIKSTSEARFIFWDSAVDGFKNNPILGIGPGNFSYAFHENFDVRMWLPENGKEILVDRTHNIFFETLIGGGILLSLSLLLFFITIIVGLIKSIKNGKISKLYGALLVGAFSGWLLQAQFVFDSVASLLMLFLVCGIAYGSLSIAKEEKKNKVIYLSSKDKFVMFFTVLFIIILFVYSVILPFKKDRLLYQTYNTGLPARADMWKDLEGISRMGDSSDSVKIFNKIMNTYEANEEVILKSSPEKKEIYLKELDEIIKYLSILVDKKDNYDLILINAKISYLRMYFAGSPSDYLIEKSNNLIEKAITISPVDPKPYWIKAQIKLLEGDTKTAKDLLEKAFFLGPSIEYTHYLILQLETS